MVPKPMTSVLIRNRGREKCKDEGDAKTDRDWSVAATSPAKPEATRSWKRPETESSKSLWREAGPAGTLTVSKDTSVVLSHLLLLLLSHFSRVRPCATP